MRPRLLIKPSLAALCGLLLCVPVASASRAEIVNGTAPDVGCKGCGPLPVSHLRFTASPGEENRVQVTADGNTLRVRDSVPIEAGPGCSADPGGGVSCTPGVGPRRSVFLLGDGADTFAVIGAEPAGFLGVAVDGGPGDDRLTGSGMPDSLHGGGGIDRLDGAGGDDSLSDGDTAPFPVDVDQVIGGAGRDFVDYSDHSAPVAVRLDADGGSSDRLSGIEAAFGGRGDDLMVAGPGGAQFYGGPGDDRLEGGAATDNLGGDAGDDVLEGRGGGDAIDGGAGRDRLSGGDGDDSLNDSRGGARDRFDGGAGNDEISATDHAVETIVCGSGSDLVEAVVGPVAKDILAPDCERAQESFDEADPSVLVHPLSGSRTSLRFRTPCVRCRVRLGIRVGGRLASVASVRRSGRFLRVTLRHPLPLGIASTVRVRWEFGRAELNDFRLEYALLLRALR